MNAILSFVSSSESVEWYTPPEYIQAVKEVLGTIDLDPASCREANETVQADCYWIQEDEALDQIWRGRVFLNPPYGWCYPDGRIPPPRYNNEGKKKQGKPPGTIPSSEAWSRKLIEQFEAGNVKEAILLVNANTGEQWFQPLWQFPICFVDHRIRFNTTGGQKGPQPTKSNAFVYFGRDPARFERVFGRFGPIVTDTRQVCLEPELLARLCRAAYTHQ